VEDELPGVGDGLGLEPGGLEAGGEEPDCELPPQFTELTAQITANRNRKRPRARRHHLENYSKKDDTISPRVLCRSGMECLDRPVVTVRSSSVWSIVSGFGNIRYANSEAAL